MKRLPAINVFKARGEEVRSVCIMIDGPVPEAVSLEAARHGYRLQAEALLKAFESLPGGTVDALFAQLAASKAGLLAVPNPKGR